MDKGLKKTLLLLSPLFFLLLYIGASAPQIILFPVLVGVTAAGFFKLFDYYDKKNTKRYPLNESRGSYVPSPNAKSPPPEQGVSRITKPKPPKNKLIREDGNKPKKRY